MSSYRYAGSSTIATMVLHQGEHRAPVARLVSAPGATAVQLAAVRSALEARGWESVPVFAEGQAALQVSGFKQRSELDGFLRARGFVAGQAESIGQPQDMAPKPSRGGRIQQMSLKLAGFFNLIGNGSMMIDGTKKQDHYRLVGGGLLTLGAANLVRYGNAKPEYYQRAVAQNLAEFVRKEGGAIPAGSELAHVARHGRSGVIAGIEDTLYHYPAQVTLGIDSVGASAMLASGIRKMQNGHGWGGLGFGISSLGLKLLSMVLPEKSQAEIEKSDREHRNPLTRTIEWLRAKPLRIYGYGSMVGDVMLGVDAYHQYKNHTGRKFIYTAVSATTYMLADIMYAISSKDHTNADGKFNPDEQRAIEAMAAEYVAQQPEGARERMAQKLGGFLTTRKEIQGNSATVGRAIIEQARHLQENPWVNRIDSEAGQLSNPLHTQAMGRI